jgi:hypothetical protein
MADAVAELMTINGYERFIVSGGDVGSSVAEQLARRQTAAVGLTDSPAGLAAWIVEKLRSWSDCDGQCELTALARDVVPELAMADRH